jgi:hypothetical protein
MMAAGLVPCDDMMRMLVEQGPPEIVMFLDACRSDASIRVPRPHAQWNLANESGRHLRAAVGRAAQPKAVAWEVPHDAPTRGAFSTLLVNGLRAHRVNGQLTLSALEDYICSNITNLVSPKTQYPDFDERPKPRKIVLAVGQSLPDDPEVVIRFGAGRVGQSLWLIGGPHDIRKVIIGTADPQTLALPPGAYALETKAGEKLKTFAHRAPGGTHVEI